MICLVTESGENRPSAHLSLGIQLAQGCVGGNLVPCEEPEPTVREVSYWVLSITGAAAIGRRDCGWPSREDRPAVACAQVRQALSKSALCYFQAPLPGHKQQAECWHYAMSVLPIESTHMITASGILVERPIGIPAAMQHSDCTHISVRPGHHTDFSTGTCKRLACMRTCETQAARGRVCGHHPQV